MAHFFGDNFFVDKKNRYSLEQGCNAHILRLSLFSKYFTT